MEYIFYFNFQLLKFKKVNSKSSETQNKNTHNKKMQN